MALALSRSHYLLTRVRLEPLCMGCIDSLHGRNNISDVGPSTPLYISPLISMFLLTYFRCISRSTWPLPTDYMPLTASIFSQ